MRKEALAEIVKAVQGAGAGKKSLIVGYADNQDGRDHNQVLSARRAEAVTSALTKDYQASAAWRRP